jgi:Ca-activated chloride channel family protein
VNVAKVAVLAAAVGLVLVATQAGAAQPVLRVSSELVVMHVSVVDDDRRPVPDLPCDAFRVYESNQPQDITICVSGNEPLALGLVIDSSTSMGRYRELLAQAGKAFVSLGSARNDVFVLMFNEHVRSALPAGNFTRDPQQVERAVQDIPMRGMTALHDAIAAAIGWAQRSEHLKKAVLLVSDGGDNASRLPFDRVLQQALRANVAFFAIAISDLMNRDANPEKLRRLARETGGLVFSPSHRRAIEEAFGSIAADLQSGYTLAFVTNHAHAAGSYCSLRVTVPPLRGEKLSVRTRAGYVPSEDSHDASR